MTRLNRSLTLTVWYSETFGFLQIKPVSISLSLSVFARKEPNTMSGYAQKVGGAVTQFSDTFNRGTLNPLGQNSWTHILQTLIPIANPFTYGTAFCNGASQIVLSGQG